MISRKRYTCAPMAVHCELLPCAAVAGDIARISRCISDIYILASIRARSPRVVLISLQLQKFSRNSGNCICRLRVSLSNGPIDVWAL